MALVPRAGKGTRHRSVAALEPQASPLLYLPDTQRCPVEKPHTEYIIIPQLQKFRPNQRLLDTESRSVGHCVKSPAARRLCTDPKSLAQSPTPLSLPRRPCVSCPTRTCLSGLCYVQPHSHWELGGGCGSQELELDPEVWVGVWHEQQPYRQDNSHLQIELAELPASGVNI